VLTKTLHQLVVCFHNCRWKEVRSTYQGQGIESLDSADVGISKFEDEGEAGGGRKTLCKRVRKTVGEGKIMQNIGGG